MILRMTPPTCRPPNPLLTLLPVTLVCCGTDTICWMVEKVDWYEFEGWYESMGKEVPSNEEVCGYNVVDGICSYWSDGEDSCPEDERPPTFCCADADQDWSQLTNGAWDQTRRCLDEISMVGTCGLCRDVCRRQSHALFLRDMGRMDR